MTALFALKNVIQRFGQREVLNIPELELRGGIIYVLQGPNGAGKTTLMRILSFMDTPAEGEICFMGEKVQPGQSARYRARVVWVPQSPVMFTGTLLYNIEYPMRIKKAPRRERKARAMDLLASVGLDKLAKAPAPRLSGGEAQRASIARALAAGAEVILFDEPTASVDYRSRGEIIGIIRQLCHERGLSIIVTTHDAALTEELAQQRITLFDGKIVPCAPGYPATASQFPPQPLVNTRAPFKERTENTMKTASGTPARKQACVANLHIDRADPAFSLLLQSGVSVSCMAGIPLRTLLSEEFGLDAGQMSRLDVFLLNGKPVDNPEETLVPSGSRLALAAGLPGIAGLAMKSNSAVKGLRPGITHGADGAGDSPVPAGPGSIELVLYSLALSQLAAHFLGRGFAISAVKLLERLMTGPRGVFSLDGQALELPSVVETLAALPPEDMVFLTADLEKTAQ